MKHGEQLIDIASRLAPFGLIVRGAFHAAPEDGVPPMGSGATVSTLVMIGNVGSAPWSAFSASPEYADGRPDPMNRWSARVIGGVAADIAAATFYPSDGPPYPPFLRWARRAEPVHPSPLGMLIHPDHGLWHAYRGALGLAQRIELPAQDDRSSPCDSCVDRPCLDGCPVTAFGPAGYDVPACIGHIDSTAGLDCLERACLARRACPIGRQFVYQEAQSGFHMKAFLQSNRGDRRS